MTETSSDPSGGEARMHFLDYWRVIRIRLPLILLVFMLVVGTGSITTYLMPRRYMSSVTVQIRENDTSLRVFHPVAVEPFNPHFVTSSSRSFRGRRSFIRSLRSFSWTGSGGFVPSDQSCRLFLVDPS